MCSPASSSPLFSLSSSPTSCKLLTSLFYLSFVISPFRSDIHPPTFLRLPSRDCAACCGFPGRGSDVFLQYLASENTLSFAPCRVGSQAALGAPPLPPPRERSCFLVSYDRGPPALHPTIIILLYNLMSISQSRDHPSFPAPVSETLILDQTRPTCGR